MDFVALFFASLVAATLFPVQSETVLAALLLQGTHPVWVLVAVASVGNILGSCANWALGWWGMHYAAARWFPFSAATIAKAQQQFQRYGRWTLLLAWLPIVGDPLTLVAGMARVPFGWFVLLVSVGKVGRYAVLAWAVL